MIAAVLPKPCCRKKRVVHVKKGCLSSSSQRSTVLLDTMLSSTTRTTERNQFRVECKTTCSAKHIHHSSSNVHVCFATLPAVRICVRKPQTGSEHSSRYVFIAVTTEAAYNSSTNCHRCSCCNKIARARRQVYKLSQSDAVNKRTMRPSASVRIYRHPGRMVLSFAQNPRIAKFISSANTPRARRLTKTK